MTFTKGEIWTVTLDPTVANEQSGTRPCIVVSDEPLNMLPINHRMVVPLTTRDRGFLHHVHVVDDGGLNRPSWAMCEAVRTVSTKRFGQRIGTVTAETTEAVVWQITRWLGRRT